MGRGEMHPSMAQALFIFTISHVTYAAAAITIAEPHAFGLIHPPEARNTDPATAAYLESLKNVSLPDSWDGRDHGYVSSVEHQRGCGSCVVFTNIALIEACIARVGDRSAPDLSEQEALLCAYDGKSATGCSGAMPEAYIDWVVERGGYMADELSLPYHPRHLNFTCPSSSGVPRNCHCPKDLPDDLPGVAVVGRLAAQGVDEETLKALVFIHGAAQVAVSAQSDSFHDYKGGIFQGCKGTRETNHALVLIGWGRDAESGMDYWVAKNSWGPNWGEGGYMRIERGVGRCGIGEMVAAVNCEKVDGPTTAPVTTTTTLPPRKLSCDLLDAFGGFPLDVTGMELHIEGHDVEVDCQAGQCAPSPPVEFTNACTAICGSDPCYSSRSLPDLQNLQDLRVSISLQNLLSLLQN